LKAVFTANH